MTSSVPKTVYIWATLVNDHLPLPWKVCFAWAFERGRGRGRGWGRGVWMSKYQSLHQYEQCLIFHNFLNEEICRQINKKITEYCTRGRDRCNVLDISLNSSGDHFYWGSFCRECEFSFFFIWIFYSVCTPKN